MAEPHDRAHMTGGSESLWEAANTKTEVLNAKHKTRIGFWNVQTMYETGRLAQITSEMQRYSLTILGISECRWTDSGDMKTASGETLLYSGRRDGQHREGVAVMLKKGTERCLLQWKPLSSRLMTVRLKGRHTNLSIIQCYAPTNDSSDEDKDEFYGQLENCILEAPRHDVLLVMGDLNAKVGSSNEHFERVLGKEGCGAMNENGLRLVELCAHNNLVVGGTLFNHRDIHKLTWTSPNDRDHNQIDHIMINGTWRSSLLDVRVRRGADVSSDHYLVVATLRLKLRSAGKKPSQSRRPDVSQLKIPQQRINFVLHLRNRFEALADLATHEDEDPSLQVDRLWDEVKTAYSSASKQVLGTRKKATRKQWIKEATHEAIEARRVLRTQLLGTKSPRLHERLKTQYREANQKVKKLARKDKRDFVEEMASRAEEAAQRGDQGELYKITKLVCGKFHNNSNAPITGKDGKLLATKQEQEKRWAEHFKEVLNQPDPTAPAEVHTRDLELDISTDPPTQHEIRQVIQSLKNGKAPGSDLLCPEFFKVAPAFSASVLHPLFEAIWLTGKVPDDWKRGIIIKIPKKGTLTDCNNWRGITLLSVPGKILGKIIYNRVCAAVDDHLRKEQAGFRKGRGCVDHIFALRNIIEQCAEWQRGLYVNFIDFRKAFDSVHRDSLWKIVRAYGIPDSISDIIKSYYDGYTCSVGNSDIMFQVKTGVRQGCVLSTLLFNLVIDWVLSRTTEDQKRGIRWTLYSTLEDLDYADDLALVAHTHHHIQEKTDRLTTFAAQVGLRVNTKKTEVMTLNTNNPNPVKLGNDDLQYVDRFTYLGSIITTKGGADEDIKNRLNKARNAFRMLNSVWRSSQYSYITKLKLYKCCVISTLLYGAECWRITDTDIRKVDTFHTKNLRRILKIYWPTTISNEALFERCDTDSISNMVMRRRWTWVGHVLRREHDSLLRTALHWTPEGKRRRGRPKTTWRRTFETEMKAARMSWGQVRQLADDRGEWRKLVAALCARRHNGQ